MALWDGRFSGDPADEMRVFSASLDTDLLMWEEDIAGSVAHAKMLQEVGLLRDDEHQMIVDGLQQVSSELASGWQPDLSSEDIHMAVEGRLHEIIGPVAGKLHTARSRNDQVATDVRLWLRARLDVLGEEVGRLIEAIICRVEVDGRVLIPGYTHLQRGQPIWLGHHLLAHAWSLYRDRDRLIQARRRVNQSPLGAAAMAGTPHPIDRERTADLLCFDSVIENAMDAVSARDHVLESVAAAAILATHLSRMAEELVVWSSREFSLVQLSEAWSTGSSIMPQKRNPDAAELIRGKTGRVFGSLVSLLTMMKGLPLAYNRDMQEDRAAVFEAIGVVTACTRVMSGCIESLVVLEGPELKGDSLLATELADFLAERGVPFRQGHQIVGRIVADLEKSGRNLADLNVESLRSYHEAFDEQALLWLDPTVAVERRTSRGGTAWCEILRQVALIRATAPGT